MIGVYKITHVLSGWVYIGSSFNMGKRFADHKRSLLNREHVNTFLQALFEYGGIRALKFEVIATYSNISKDDLLAYERYYIEQQERCLNVVKDPLFNEYTHGRV